MSSANPAIGSAGSLAHSIFQQGAGQIDAYNAVYSQNLDLGGTQHFVGPAALNANGNYYIQNMAGAAQGQAINSDGYTWSQGYTWLQGYTWS